MPGSQVRAEAVNDSIILTGLVTSPGEADRVVQVARAFVSAPEKVMNMMTVAGSDQVTLKVRVVEVQRTAIKQLGLRRAVTRPVLVQAQSASTGSGGSAGSRRHAHTFSRCPAQPAMGPAAPTSRGLDWDSPATAVSLQPDQGMRASFERVGLVRTLAEPNLTVGQWRERAKFLAGGEFPVPVGRDQRRQYPDSVEYKPYGVRLAFRPVVLSEGRISLQLSTEVSELTTPGRLHPRRTGRQRPGHPSA